MIYKTIDLCAGIGGIRRGFELTGKFENVLSAEIDPSAARTYQHIFGDNPLNDLTSEEFKDTVARTEYDILLAGFPCQSFSRVGKQLGFRDKTRGTIFFDIADIISRTNPRAILLENVENLVSHDKGQTIKTIIETLEDELDYRVIGVTLDDDGNYKYTPKSFIRNSKYFGIPQNRPRVYIMAFSKKELNSEELTENNQENNVLFYINPLNKGIAFSRSEITHYLEQMKLKPTTRFYSPCHNLEIIKMLVYNQLSCYDQNGNKDKANQLKELFDLFVSDEDNLNIDDLFQDE